MGIPVGLYRSGALVLPPRAGGLQSAAAAVCAVQPAPAAGAEHAGPGGTAGIDDKVVCDQWTLKSTVRVLDPRLASGGAGRRCYKMGPFWCSWDRSGSNCCIVADVMEGRPRVVDLSRALGPAEEVTCVVVVRRGDGVVCGTSRGRLVHVSVGSGQVLAEHVLSTCAVGHIWHDGETGFVALTEGDGVVHRVALRADAAPVSHHKLQLPGGAVRSASLSPDQQYLCLADDRQIHFYRWASRSSPFRSVPICQESVDTDTITRVAWDPNARMVLVCTTERVLCYDSQDHWISVVTRQPCRLVEWSPLGKLFLVGENRYGTMVQIFEHNNRGHWSSLGYTDIATKFGIRVVGQMAVTKSQLHLLHGACYESFSME